MHLFLVASLASHFALSSRSVNLGCECFWEACNGPTRLSIHAAFYVFLLLLVPLSVPDPDLLGWAELQEE